MDLARSHSHSGLGLNRIHTGETPGRREHKQHARERQTQNSCPEVIRRHRSRHSNLAVGKRKDLGRVDEVTEALSGGVKGDECEDEEGNESQVSSGRFGNIK